MNRDLTRPGGRDRIGKHSLVAAAMLLIKPALVTDAIGLVRLGGVLLWQQRAIRRAAT